MSTDELRRAMEALPGHKEMTYYHRLRDFKCQFNNEDGGFGVWNYLTFSEKVSSRLGNKLLSIKSFKLYGMSFTAL